MKFCSLASGSSGNCQYIEYKNTRILIDAGLSGKKIEEQLNNIEVDPSTIDAIFVTHEHIDHIKGVGILSRRYHIKVFSNQETLQAMLPTVKKLNSEKIFLFENEKPFLFQDLHISPISTFHDCRKGCGFVIRGNQKISLLTDTGWINTEAMEAIADSALYYLESNHDYEMLMNGPYSWALKQRILSTHGHLSNENAGEVLAKVLKRQKEIVLLGHLSGDNNLPRLAARTVRDALANKNIMEGTDYIMEVAPRHSISSVYEL